LLAEFRVLHAEFDGGFQEAEFIPRIVRNSLVNQSPEPLFFSKDSHGIGELNLAARAGLGAFEAIEDGWWQDVASGDGEIGWSLGGLGFLDEVADAEQALTERGEGRGLTGDNAVKVSFVARNLFDRDGAGAGGVVNVDELLGSGILARDQNITKENGERLVADEILGDEHGVTKAERFFLTRVADLDHIADAADHVDLCMLAFFLKEAFQGGIVVEMIFNGIFAFAGDDDDVFDAGGHALFRDVLNLRLVDDDKHFLGLRLGSGKKTRAEAGGREYSFAHLAMGWVRGTGRNGILRHKWICASHFRGKLSDTSTVAVAREVCQSRGIRVVGEGKPARIESRE